MPNAFHAAGTEDLFLRHIVHADRNTQDGAQRDEIRADMTVADRAVVGAPVVHYIISRLRTGCPLTVAARREPGAGPGVVGTLPERIGHLVRQVDSPALRDLQNRAKTL